ncbi:hypothetical protein Tco_0286713 [Tanacetum coccineum]
MPPLLKPEVSQETTALVAAKWVAESTTTSLVSTLFYPVTNLIGVEPCRFNGKGSYACVHIRCEEEEKLKNELLRVRRRKKTTPQQAAVEPTVGRRNQEMSQSLSSNVPDNSPEQESATGHSISGRLDSPTSQANQLPELELTLNPATGHATTFSDGKPPSETPELNPEDMTARLEDIEDSLAAAESEISLLQIRVANVEDRHAEDHDQIQIILTRLGL